MPSFLRYGLALGAGAFAALGFAPWGFWPLSLVGIALLLGLVDTAPQARSAGLVGWLFGLGHFSVGLAWIATAFTFQAKMPPAMGWVAVIGLAMFLAVYGAFAVLMVRLVPFSTAGRALLLAATWMAAEWLRGVVLTGFAWNPLGAIWLDVSGLALLARYVGAIGLSGLTVLAGGALWVMVSPGATIAGRLGGGFLAALVALAAGVGSSLDGETYFGDNPAVLVIQPNIGQDVKYLPGADAAHLEAYLDLSVSGLSQLAGRQDDPGASAAAAPAAAPAGQEPTLAGDAAADAAAAAKAAQEFAGTPGARSRALIVWSESSVSGLVEDDPALRRRLAGILQPGDLLLFGGVAAVRNKAGVLTAATNSLFVLDSNARIVGRYDKAHLVPLGEYVPMRSLMSALGLARLAPGDLDFQPGPGPRTLTLPGAPPVGVQICYEIIFPHRVIDEINRPAWIVNISNDAWFGPSGPPQHLAQARLRAIEEGLPIVRATPTGISAIIDARGHILAQQPAGTAGVAGSILPPPLPQTVFGQFGHQVTAALALVLLALAFFAGGRRDED